MSGPGGEGVWRSFRRRKLALVALVCLALIGATALFAELLAADLPVVVRLEGRLHVLPALTRPERLRGLDNAQLRTLLRADRGEWMVQPLVPFGPNQMPSDEILQSPHAAHPLGTDELGRDVFARIVHGTRTSLGVGVVAVVLYVLIGTVLGLLAGYFGGTLDFLLSRLMEVMMTFPTLFLVLCILGVMRVTSLLPLMLVIGLTRWTDIARLARAEALRIRALEYVEASRALGASNVRILWKHVLPNAMPPLLVAATFGLAGAILLESGLSFLGFGAPPPAPSWGELLTQAHRYVTHVPGGGSFGAWWLTLFPGLALFVTVTAFNLVGEGLRDALDPRMAP